MRVPRWSTILFVEAGITALALQGTRQQTFGWSLALVLVFAACGIRRHGL